MSYDDEASIAKARHLITSTTMQV
ncbi:hypothetical protein ACNKHV_00045 [Shigella flexneri]